MAKYDSDKIVSAVGVAVKAAQAFAATDDGGTCNFDSAIIYVPGMSGKQVKEIEAREKRLSYWSGSKHRPAHFHVGGTSGQGLRRTRMAEAMGKSLEANPDMSGLNVSMYYQMD